MTELIQTYLACWNEQDPMLRREMLDANWADQARYVDPLVEVRGRDGIAATIAAVQGQFPGFAVTAAGPADAHPNQVRFTWNLGPAGAEPVVVGFDVIETDAQGRIQTVLGFLDRVPA